MVIVAEGAEFPDQAPSPRRVPRSFGHPRLGGIGGMIAAGIETDRLRDPRASSWGTSSAAAAQRLRPRAGHPPGPRSQPARHPHAIRNDRRPPRSRHRRDTPRRAASPPPVPSTSGYYERPRPSSSRHAILFSPKKRRRPADRSVLDICG